jgi:linoleate 8R-lipoxygenase / 9,12-octadecadienoate 8-hydroperoxide 8R-isomerase
LYGSNEAEQALVRTFTGGTLKPDTFCDARLKMFPPGVSALLVCFNRFHNYAVQQLGMINEGGRFTVPTKETTEDYDAAISKLDNDLFQTARL